MNKLSLQCCVIYDVLPQVLLIVYKELKNRMNEIINQYIKIHKMRTFIICFFVNSQSEVIQITFINKTWNDCL